MNLYILGAAAMVILLVAALTVTLVQRRRLQRAAAAAEFGMQSDANGRRNLQSASHRVDRVQPSWVRPDMYSGEVNIETSVSITSAQTRAMAQQRLVPADLTDSRVCDVGRLLRSTDGREVLVLEQDVRGAGRVRALQDLVDRLPAIHAAGNPECMDLRWPSEPLVDFDGVLFGYFAPGLDDGYLNRRDGARHPRRLDSLIEGDDEVEGGFGTEDRVAALRAVAQWLHAQHQASVVNGQVRADLIYVDGTGDRLTPAHYRAARVLGTPDWTGLTGGADSFDRDRADFATLAAYLLGVGTASHSSNAIGGIGDEAGSRVRSLLRRAQGARGTMPTMEEWLFALN